jgi:predicted O-methyltransferase YrrM
VTCLVGIEETISGWLDSLEALGGASRAECEGLLRRAAGVDSSLAIVELGVYIGQGTCCLAAGSLLGGGAHVYGIDLWGLRPTGQEPKYDDPANQQTAQSALERLGLLQYATLVRADTQEAVKNWSRPIGLLVIDAGHEKPEVLIDYLHWAPFVAPGGWLLMHDARNGGWPGVDEVITQVIGPSLLWEAEEFVEPFSQWFRKRR